MPLHVAQTASACVRALPITNLTRPRSARRACPGMGVKTVCVAPDGPLVTPEVMPVEDLMPEHVLQTNTAGLAATVMMDTVKMNMVRANYYNIVIRILHQC